MLATIVASLLSFVLGLVAAAIGARIGEALKARGELLGGLQDWIEDLNEFANLVYQRVKGDPTLLWTQQEFAELTKNRLKKSQRWLGVSRAINYQIYMATQELGKAVLSFEEMFFLDIAQAHKNPADPQWSADFKRKYDTVVNLSEDLNALIAAQILKGIPRWLIKYN
jgi:hypothetical protein